jgi:hypothetical protein
MNGKKKYFKKADIIRKLEQNKTLSKKEIRMKTKIWLGK